MQKLINSCGEWARLLKDEMDKPYFKQLEQQVKQEYSSNNVFPPYNKIFNALKLTDYNDVKVVILGQDPYHELGQATGLAFSVNEGVKLPPSLKNIYKEISSEFGSNVDNNGDLEYLARQGVLLLNTTLTVREGEANSHKNYGWDKFTDKIIELIGQNKDVIFMLWGSDAIKKQSLLNGNIVLTTTHPSPLSSYRGFMGCGHFKKANEILISQHKKPIRWARDDGQKY